MINCENRLKISVLVLTLQKIESKIDVVKILFIKCLLTVGNSARMIAAILPGDHPAVLPVLTIEFTHNDYSTWLLDFFLKKIYNCFYGQHQLNDIYSLY